MKNQLLLVVDVDDLGRSGEVVSVNPGYARNFLIPQEKAVVADKRTLRMQTKLREERAKRAVVDKKEAEEMAEKINNVILVHTVKVDSEGHMYGSVTALDIVHLFEKEGYELEKRNVILPRPIRELGEKTITLRLKEGVSVTFTLKIEAEALV